MLQAVTETKTIEKIIYTSSFFALGSTDGYVADENQVLQGFEISEKSFFILPFVIQKQMR